jgi:hypothetical protein
MGDLVLLGCMVALTVYNAVVIGLFVRDRRDSVLSCPPLIFAVLKVVFFTVEQLGVGGNVPFYDRYVLQIAPFLGIIAFSLMPRLGFARLVTLAAMSTLAHVMLWSHTFER